MHRREFLRATAFAGSLAAAEKIAGVQQAPQIAFTFDDPSTEGGANLTWQELNNRILSALAKHKKTAVLFVCGKRVDSKDGAELIGTWNAAGHGIGNHSYSHLYFNGTAGPENITLQAFESDAMKVEPQIRAYEHFAPFFRYPFFKEGNTVEKRDGMREFLKQHGYRIGRATIDASDWAIDVRLRAKLKKDSNADLSGYRGFYLQHIWERAQYYDSLSLRVMGKPVRHTLLLHHNALNALFLDDLIAMLAARGWRTVDAEWAYQDPAYDRQPKILPAGESLIWALAKESGKFEKELRYPGEDDIYENPKMDALNL